MDLVGNWKRPDRERKKEREEEREKEREEEGGGGRRQRIGKKTFVANKNNLKFKLSLFVNACVCVWG
jgi:hypothetical protein